ncbi:MAG TPA: PRC-barrel domain-containing protein [Gemmatimonadaceae bacterium]|nr:PRC-barrel domain-containing protein [Gemmatimonadaceae bacterium]
MAKDYETTDGSRLAPLGEVDDFEVAEGYPDVRGWRVDAADGTEVGKVHELLVDLDAMRTRYLDVRLTSEVAAAPEDRDVLVPIGAANIEQDHDVVRIPLTAERVGLLPPYTHGAVTREQEYEVRRHFTFGRAAAEGMAASEAASAARESRDFYDDETFDDRRFFSSRKGDREVRRADDTATVADRPVTSGESEVRVPLRAEDSVVVKRNEGGHDEIIIRRPRSDERGAS